MAANQEDITTALLKLLQQETQDRQELEQKVDNIEAVLSLLKSKLETETLKRESAEESLVTASSRVKAMEQEQVDAAILRQKQLDALQKKLELDKQKSIEAMNTRKALEQAKQINTVSRDGGAPIHHAAVTLDIEEIAKLISLGADLNLPNAAGLTPIQLADTRKGWWNAKTKIKAENVILFLREHGAKIDLSRTGGLMHEPNYKYCLTQSEFKASEDSWYKKVSTDRACAHWARDRQRITTQAKKQWEGLIEKHKELLKEYPCAPPNCLAKLRM